MLSFNSISVTTESGCIPLFYVLPIKRGMKLANKVERIVGDIAIKLADELGFEFVDCEYKKIGGENMLTIYIDKDGGVNLDDCETLSRKIEEIIDETDPIDKEYILSVSSPGLDRPVITEADFERNLGKKVYIKLYKMIEKKKEFVAVIKSYLLD